MRRRALPRSILSTVQRSWRAVLGADEHDAAARVDASSASSNNPLRPNGLPNFNSDAAATSAGSSLPAPAPGSDFGGASSHAEAAAYETWYQHNPLWAL
eukprot:3605609-Rhodomonas_salina.1